MNDITRLAADLAYAAGQGAQRIAAAVEHGGASVAEIGVKVPGSGLLHTPRSGLIASSPAADAPGVASSMAEDAAERGAKLVAGKR